jgi:hypothetical protein
MSGSYPFRRAQFYGGQCSDPPRSKEDKESRKIFCGYVLFSKLEPRQIMRPVDRWQTSFERHNSWCAISVARSLDSIKGCRHV